MPEIAEVARTVHYIRKILSSRTISSLTALDDVNVFGKVGTSGAAVQKALTGRKIVGAGQQGKYFWIEMDRPPHPLIHFGMTGEFEFNGQGVETFYYRKKAGSDKGAGTWPPPFWKFHFETKESPVIKVAFTDSRRFGRVRLMDCPAGELRKISPLKENGPDPVVDKEILTLEFFTALCQRRKVPIKALLLDQANISGIGNWVGDEVLFQARVHPEQYSNSLTSAHLTKLHSAILDICSTAVDLLVNNKELPKSWLYHSRWGKGKGPSTLPSGEKITFVTVGGRTSAVVPSLQKKTGPVAGDIKDEDDDEAGVKDESDEEKPAKGKKSKKAIAPAAAPAPSKKRKSTVKDESESEPEVIEAPAAPPAKKARKSKSKVAGVVEEASAAVTKVAKVAKKAVNGTGTGESKGKGKETKKTPAAEVEGEGRRRSGRLPRG